MPSLSLSLEAYQSIEQIEEEPLEDAESYLRSKFHEPADMDRLTRAFSADFGFILTWGQILEPYVRKGIPKDPSGWRRWRAIDRVWSEMFKVELATFAKSFDNEPTKFFYARTVLLNRRPPRFWQISPESICCRMVDAGKFGVAIGPPGAGKTDGGVKLIAEALIGLWEDHQAHRASGDPGQSRLSLTKVGLRGLANTRGESEPDEETVATGGGGMATATDFRVLTNISIGKSHAWSKYFTYVSTAHELHIELSELDMAGAFTLIILDEYHRAAGKAATREKRWLEFFARTVRKPRASLLYITQDYSDITPTIQKWMETVIEKPSASQPTAAVVTVAGVYSRRRILGIPRRSLPFNTKGYGSYTQDIDEEELSSVIGQVEGHTNADDPKEASRVINRAIIQYCSDPENWTVRQVDIQLEGNPRRRQSKRSPPASDAPD